ncbi:MAG: dihydrofolate reductase family protein [Muribaculaceae bacterium]|nr:dihydrofolate reductase family protein [Muribaculaceae bacterium]
MNRPYIICHMVESIDGRIDCSMVEHISGDEYYTTLEALDCPASIEGRVTMEHYYALPGKFEELNRTVIGKECFFRATERTDFHICPETKGTLLWESNIFEDGRPLLVITSEKTTCEYLDYLKEYGISYIVTGKEKIDLKHAMAILHDEFKVDRLAVLGGGVINGGFLEAGLIDEISLLLAPGIDGREGWRAMFDGIANQDKLPTKLKLTALERLENDVVWLRYNVLG